MVSCISSLVGLFPPPIVLFTLTKLLSYGRSSHFADYKEVKLLKAHVVSLVQGRKGVGGAGHCAVGGLIKQMELCCVEQTYFFAKGRNGIEISLLLLPKLVFSLQTIAQRGIEGS